jgi:hypothetical protein
LLLVVLDNQDKQLLVVLVVQQRVKTLVLVLHSFLLQIQHYRQPTVAEAVLVFLLLTILAVQAPPELFLLQVLAELQVLAAVVAVRLEVLQQLLVAQELRMVVVLVALALHHLPRHLAVLVLLCLLTIMRPVISFY